MALNFSFFRKTPHRVYHYEYRYYDPRKEAMEERLARLHEGEMAKKGIYVPGRFIRTHMRKNIYGNRKDSGKMFITRIVILLSLAVLIIAAYYLADGLAFLLTPTR